MIQNLDRIGIFCKIAFDGFDFLRTEIGQSLIPEDKYPIVIGTTYLPKLYDNAEGFIDYCKCDNGYINNLMNKYSCGLYKLSQSNNERNPWKDKPYILFNSKMLKGIYKQVPETKDISFWVCPAYNENNEIEAIGFRIVNPEIVKKSFKWIFTCGNNIIYGKNTVDKEKPCYIVEGYRDYIALNELGINCIGLGSVVISEQQEEYIKTLKEPILLLDNDNFGLQKTMQYKDKYKIATLVGTKEKDSWDAYCKGEIHICLIK